jgi:hypothetical protein
MSEQDAPGASAAPVTAEEWKTVALRFLAEIKQLRTDLAAERDRLLMERDSAREQFDRHVEWAEAEAAKLRAERDEARKALEVLVRAVAHEPLHPASRPALAAAEKALAR